MRLGLVTADGRAGTKISTPICCFIYSADASAGKGALDKTASGTDLSEFPLVAPMHYVKDMGFEAIRTTAYPDIHLPKMGMAASEILLRVPRGDYPVLF